MQRTHFLIYHYCREKNKPKQQHERRNQDRARLEPPRALRQTTPCLWQPQRPNPSSSSEGRTSFDQGNCGEAGDKLAPRRLGNSALEIIDVGVESDEALEGLGEFVKALKYGGSVRGGDKLVWLKSTDLLADSPTTRAKP